MQEVNQNEGHSKSIGVLGRDAKKEKHWRELVQKHNTCQMSVRQFCIAEKVNENNFYAWRKIIRQRDSVRNNGQSETKNGLFLPVRIQTEQSCEQFLAIELPGGARIKVTSNTNLDLLSAVMKFLGRE